MKKIGDEVSLSSLRAASEDGGRRLATYTGEVIGVKDKVQVTEFSTANGGWIDVETFDPTHKLEDVLRIRDEILADLG